MTRIQRGQYQNYLAAIGRIAEQGGTISLEMGDRLVPTVAVQPFDPEMYHLIDESLHFAGRVQAAVGGQYTYAGIFNPANSRRLVILEKWWVGGPATFEWQTSFAETSLGSATSSFARDTRQPYGLGAGTSGGQGQLLGGTNAVLSTGQTATGWRGRVTAAITDFREIPGTPWVFAPGTGLYVWTRAVNVQTDTGALWRERPVGPAERE